MNGYLSAAFEIEQYLDSVRQTLHRHPELGNNEFFTSSFLEGELKALGLDVKQILDTALVAVLHGGKPGDRVALRADMDALPVTEATGCSFESENKGIMHACGHDIHMTAALGAARLLSQRRNELKGDVVFLFQPNEEVSGGAKRMIEAGALKGIKAVFGGHVAPDLPVGTIGIKYGKFYAASSIFRVIFKGRSCHGATPEMGADALLTAAKAILGLKTIYPSSGDKAVISTGTLNAGTACNIIPGEAVIEGVIRTLGKNDKAEMVEKFKSVIEETCSEYGTSAEVIITGSYDGVVNTDPETAIMEKSARQVIGDSNVTILNEPTMVTEDFGFFVNECSGCFCHVGAGCTESLHSPHFLPDIKAAVYAAAVYARTLENSL